MQRKKMVTTLAVVALVLAGAFAFAMLQAPALGVGTGVNARVRVIHASPDAPAVDVWVNGAPAFTNLAYKGITSYAMLRAGTYNVKVVPAGMTSPVVIQANLTLKGNTDYTVMAIGTLAQIHPLVLVDNSAPAPADQARVRFVHASPDAPAVDIAVQNGPVLFSNVSFGQSGGYITVPAGSYPLEVRLAGTSTVALSLGNIALKGGQTYSAFAVGLAGNGSLTALLSLDYSNPSTIR